MRTDEVTPACQQPERLRVGVRPRLWRDRNHGLPQDACTERVPGSLVVRRVAAVNGLCAFFAPCGDFLRHLYVVSVRQQRFAIYADDVTLKCDALAARNVATTKSVAIRVFARSLHRAVDLCRFFIARVPTLDRRW
jgi:hypothetical protein